MTAQNGFSLTRRRNLLLSILLPIVLMLVGAWSVASTSEATGKLPALIVNNDEMVTQVNKDGSTTPVVAGRLLVSWLTDPDNAGQYDWELANAETAQQRLDDGSAYVVVTIPETFSASVVSAGTGDPMPARVTVVTSQAHDYQTGEVTQQIFDGLIAQFGQQITNQIAVGLADGVNQSADGLQQAADGAGKLADGAGQLGDGFDQFAEGTTQLADGAGQSADGASQLASGASDLDSGVQQYVAGVDQFVGGAGQLADGVGSYVDGVDSYVEGVNGYVDGVQQLNSGMQQLRQGATQFQDASSQLSGMASQLDGVAGQVEGIREQLGGLEELLGGLASVDPAQLYAICGQLTDANQQATCTATIDELVGTLSTSGVDPAQIQQFLDQADAGLDQLSQAGPQLQQLADGLSQFSDGVVQAADGSAQLASGGDKLVAGGEQLRDGGEQLAGGASELGSGGEQLAGAGGQLADGTTQLADGTTQLADGLVQLADGADQLSEGTEPLGDGIDELADGARNMQTALQDGADQATSALTDTDSFASMVSEPVQSETTALHDPGAGGLIASLLVPIGTWIAGFVTAIRRRVVTDELLDSSASNLGILVAGIRRMFLPVAVVAIALAALVHLVLGVPFQAIGGTLLFGLLAGLASSALHLLMAVFWPRRNAAVASLTLLLVQLLTVRGIVPFELRAPWVGTVSMFTPVGQAATGMQALYAGGNAGAVIGAAIGLVLVTVAALLVTTVALGTRRKTTLTSLAAA